MKEAEALKPGIKAMCLFVHKGKTLACKGYDENKKETFYRVIGGGVNFGEKSVDAVRREIQEELGCEIENLEFVKAVENIFTFNGNPGHETVFLYRGDLGNKSLYEQEKIRITEPYGVLEAEWISIDDVLNGKVHLYPSLNYSEVLNK